MRRKSCNFWKSRYQTWIFRAKRTALIRTYQFLNDIKMGLRFGLLLNKFPVHARPSIGYQCGSVF
jgi:hypothetical protein